MQSGNLEGHGFIKYLESGHQYSVLIKSSGKITLALLRLSLFRQCSYWVMVTHQLCPALVFFTCSLGNAMGATPLFDKRRGNCLLFNLK